MDFVIAGAAAVGAGFFTNPLEVLKTRMQLQGELHAKGEYTVHYKNTIHATYMIAKHDGILSLQKGLSPALWVQFILNGVRLGWYQKYQQFKQSLCTISRYLSNTGESRLCLGQRWEHSLLQECSRRGDWRSRGTNRLQSCFSGEDAFTNTIVRKYSCGISTQAPGDVASVESYFQRTRGESR
jgi:hypothetical protein